MPLPCSGLLWMGCIPNATRRFWHLLWTQEPEQGGICTVRIDDLDVSDSVGVTMVTEKGSKTRGILFNKATTILLYRWMEKRNAVVPELFYDVDTLKPLKPNGLYQLFRRLGRRAGVKGHYNPHSFRHAFAKGYAKAGGNIFTLAEIMGHESIE